MQHHHVQARCRRRQLVKVAAVLNDGNTFAGIRIEDFFAPSFSIVSPTGLLWLEDSPENPKPVLLSV